MAWSDQIHLTHRCHDRRFLLRFARDRDQYRRRLREAVLDSEVSLLTYNITSNHVHLLVYVEPLDSTARLMQQAAGEMAPEYNRRKDPEHSGRAVIRRRWSVLESIIKRPIQPV